MAANNINIGDRLEISALQEVGQVYKTGDKPDVYKSIIYDIKKNGDLEIAMPSEAGKMVLLSVGIRYEMVIISKSGLFRTVAQVKERYKSNNIYMLLMELKTSILKHQRREYYRFPCSIQLQFFQMTEEEEKMEHAIDIFYHHEELFFDEEMGKGTIIDISGGGICFISEEILNKNSYLLLSFKLCSGENERNEREYLIRGRILKITKLGNDSRKFEYRIEFMLLNSRTREQIIKYIFEEERKHRKNA